MNKIPTSSDFVWVGGVLMTQSRIREMLVWNSGRVAVDSG
jgi:hypothetical protein